MTYYYYMDYHNFCRIQLELNSIIDRLEDNQQIFANHLADLERDYPHFYYQTEFYKLRNAIATLKQVRDAIGSIDWA
jgi:hypothetical protein